MRDRGSAPATSQRTLHLNTPIQCRLMGSDFHLFGHIGIYLSPVMLVSFIATRMSRKHSTAT